MNARLELVVFELLDVSSLPIANRHSRESAVAALRVELKEAKRWDGVCCGESDADQDEAGPERETRARRHPIFQAAWRWIKVNRDSFYHAYCILAQVDRLVTGYFAEQQHGDMHTSASLLPFGRPRDTPASIPRHHARIKQPLK